MQEKECMRRYAEAAAILPVRLRTLALSLPDEVQARAEEFRLRAGRPMTVLTPEGEMALEGIVEPEELETLCDLATEFSRYAASETLRDGFLPVRGGFRVGICGTAVMKEGVSTNLKVSLPPQCALPGSTRASPGIWRPGCSPTVPLSIR
ncbi:MAG: hypothetical protein V8R55_01045 [Dysosmobacter sp.]